MSVQRTMMIKVSAQANNNKFYEIICDGDTVTKRWGRVGSSGQCQSLNGGISLYRKTIRSKGSRGYVIVEDGATNTVAETAVSAAAHEQLSAVNDDELSRLIDYLVSSNKHQIADFSGGRITVNGAGKVESALGPVMPSSVARARALIARMAVEPSRRLPLVEEYLTLIPQRVPRGWQESFGASAEHRRKQLDFLDQLDAAHQQSVPDSGQAGQLFDMRLRPLADAHEEQRVLRLFEAGRHSSHRSSSLRVRRIWKIEHGEARTAEWEGLASKAGNVRELWHGTRVHNVLSILHQGLVVPASDGSDSIQITGRMFGDGVYLSDQSTKSLNYSAGLWAGAHQPHCCMFLTRTVLGHEYRPYQNGGWRGAASVREAHAGGFDSITVKGGTCGVRNNETVVWRPEQVLLSHLVEFDC